jgi:phosphohistidine phosphatase
LCFESNKYSVNCEHLPVADRSLSNQEWSYQSTMKTLYLIRHAKAIDHSGAIEDYYRSLSERGINDAHLMAKKMRKQDVNPQYVISSPATRALTTAIVFSKILDYPVNKIQLDESLYESTCKAYFNAITQVPDNVNTLLLFAHNPTITDFANLITGDVSINHIPTSGIIGISVNSWKEADLNKGRLILFDYPQKTM